MKYDVLDNFISPITGRTPITYGYVNIGDRNGFSVPSPILTDIKLDIIQIRHTLDELFASNFIIGKPSSLLTDSQDLSKLTNGYLINTDGVVSIGGSPSGGMEPLAYKNIWIGNANEVATASETIYFENLPPLTTTDIPNPTAGDFIGYVYEGTSSGVPKASSIVAEMFSDLLLINAKLLAGSFIMASHLPPPLSFLNAQYLNELTAGTLLITKSDGSGNLESLILQENEILLGGISGPISSAVILESNLCDLKYNHIFIGDENDRPMQVFASFALNDSPFIIKTPDDSLPNAQAISDLPGGSLLVTRVNNTGQIDPLFIPLDHLVIGGETRATTTKTILLDNMPALTYKKIWQGNLDNRVEEVDLEIAPKDSSYYIRLADDELPNAQVLSYLGTGITKLDSSGFFEIAIAGEDYATAEQLEELVEEAKGYAEQAEESATSAEESATAAEESSASAEQSSLSATQSSIEAGFSAAEASAAAGEATAAAVESTAAAAASTASATAAALSALFAGNSSDNASDYADDAEDYADEAASSANSARNSANSASSSANNAQTYLNTLLSTGITIEGDVVGSGGLSSPIELIFAENPVFTGTSFMQIPGGLTDARPDEDSTNPAMIRFNSETDNLEYSNLSKEWLPIGNQQIILQGAIEGTGTGEIETTLTSPELNALSDFSELGIMARIGDSMYTTRKLQAGGGIYIENGDGIEGDPIISYAGSGDEGAPVTISSTQIPVEGSMIIASGMINLDLGAELSALYNFDGLGFLVRTDTGQYSARELVAGTGIAIEFPNGIEGNPVISSNSSVENISLTGAIVSTPSETNPYELVTKLNSDIVFQKATQKYSFAEGTDVVESYTVPEYDANTTVITEYTKKAGAFNSIRWQEIFEFSNVRFTNNAFISSYSLKIRMESAAGVDSRTPFKIDVQNTNLNPITILFSAQLNMQNNSIINVKAAENDTEVVIKSQLDELETLLRNDLTTPVATPSSILQGYVYSTYSSELSVGDHFKFTEVSFNRGSSIILDATSPYSTNIATPSLGRIKLIEGKTYKLVGSANNAQASDNVTIQWYNVSDNLPIGIAANISNNNSSVSRLSSATAVGYFTALNTTLVELRILTNTFVSIRNDELSSAWCTIEEI